MAVLRCLVGAIDIEVSLASLSFVKINSSALAGCFSEIIVRRFIHPWISHMDVVKVFRKVPPVLGLA